MYNKTVNHSLVQNMNFKNQSETNPNFQGSLHLYLQAGWGYDFRRNMSIAWDDYGEYATDIFTKEAVKVKQIYISYNLHHIFKILCFLGDC